MLKLKGLKLKARPLASGAVAGDFAFDGTSLRGHTGTEWKTAAVVSTDPSVSFTSPTVVTEGDHGVTFSGSYANAPAGAYLFRVKNGSPSGSPTSISAGNGTWSMSGLSAFQEGEVWFIVLTDSGFGPLCRSTEEVTVAAAPTVSFTSPTSILGNATGVTFSGSYANAPAGAYVYASLNGSPQISYGVQISGGTWEIDMTGATFTESAVWSALMVDSQANLLCSAAEEVTIGPAPTISLDVPSMLVAGWTQAITGTYSGGGWITITLGNEGEPNELASFATDYQYDAGNFGPPCTMPAPDPSLILTANLWASAPSGVPLATSTLNVAVMPDN